MATESSFDDIVNKMQQSDTREQIQHQCREFCRHIGFDHYLLFGSIFTSMLSPPCYVLNSPGVATRNKKHHLDNIIRTCINSATPVITGNIDKQSNLYNSLFVMCRVPSSRELAISFPVHFPTGKFAFLHVFTKIKKQDIHEKVMMTLAPGNLFAREAGAALLRQLECDLENNPPYLSQREKECLLLASDGASPRQIGNQVGLSPHTVIFHLKRAREKLQAKNIQGAVSKAMLRGDIGTRIGSEKG